MVNNTVAETPVRAEARRKIKIPLGTFSNKLDEELQARMEIGLCEFEFTIMTDLNPSEPKGTLRHAKGTRNLSMSFISFSDIPRGIMSPADHVCTFYDYHRRGWRCFVRHALKSVSEYIEIEA